MLNNNAVQKVSTANPPTILVHKRIINALITSKNNPNVSSVTGSVNKIKRGLIKTLSKLKTTATIIDVVKLATKTPDIKWAIIITEIAVVKRRKSNFMFLLLNYFFCVLSCFCINLLTLSKFKRKIMKKLLLFFTVLSVSNLATAQWVSQATGFTPENRGVFNINIVDANTVWALSYDGSGGAANVQEFTKTTDGGSNWTTGIIDISDTSLELTNLTAVSGTTAWVGAVSPTNGKGGVWKTVDSGVTWTQQNSGAYSDASSFFNVVHFFDANSGITQGDPITSTDFEVYRTTDGGETWDVVPAASLPDIESGETGYNGGNEAAGNSFWFVTSKGKLYRTLDKGVTWSKYNTPLTDFSGTTVEGSIYFADNNIGILLARTGAVASATYKIYKTTNGGLNWGAGVAYTQPYRTLAFIPGSTILVGTGFSVSGTTKTYSSAYSTDYGATWTKIDSGVQRTGLTFLNGTTGWAGGFTIDNTTGGIFKYTGPSLATNSVTVKSKFTVSPNPTTGIIKLASGTESINEVGVFDLLGKQVYGSKFSALNEVNLDLTSLQTGAYLLKVSSNTGNTESIKIMKN